MERILHTLEDTRICAEEVLTFCKEHNCNVIGLYGDLGAGKTAFTKEMAVQLGISETVTSPTFIIMKVYNTLDSVFKQMVHIDAYRFEDENEVRVLDIQKYIQDPSVITMIEWPEKIGGYMPPHMKITIAILEDGSRILTTHYEKN